MFAAMMFPAPRTPPQRHRGRPALAMVAALFLANCTQSPEPTTEPQVKATRAPARPTATKTPEEPLGPRPIAPPAPLAAKVGLEKVLGGLERPVQVTFAPEDSDERMFVVQQYGKILIFQDGELEPVPFADLSEEIARGHRALGLLSMAFHPEFQENGKVYVNLTRREDGATEILEFRVDPSDPNRLDPQTRRRLLRIEQPYENHNGGDLQFGPDGHLYTGMGDGGASGDLFMNAQNDDLLLGKMLRIDVDTEEPTIEVIQKGLRNPWRISFDRETGDLYMGDVGEIRWESVLRVGADDLEGHNFGWRITEGGHCFPPQHPCKPEEFTSPIVEYTHDMGCSITGGFVYRGKAIPELDGTYFYGDWCTALLRSFRWQNGEVVEHFEWRPALDPDDQLATLTSFGEDQAGELYLVSLDGMIWKLVPAQNES